MCVCVVLVFVCVKQIHVELYKCSCIVCTYVSCRVSCNTDVNAVWMLLLC